MNSKQTDRDKGPKKAKQSRDVLEGAGVIARAFGRDLNGEQAGASLLEIQGTACQAEGTAQAKARGSSEARVHCRS